MFDQLLIHRVLQARTSTEAVNDKQSRLNLFFHSSLIRLVELEHLLIAKDECANGDEVSITEAKVDVFALNVLHRYRGQFEHVQLG